MLFQDGADNVQTEDQAEKERMLERQSYDGTPCHCHTVGRQRRTSCTTIVTVIILLYSVFILTAFVFNPLRRTRPSPPRPELDYEAVAGQKTFWPESELHRSCHTSVVD